jgi:hypothetical protein
MKYPSHCRSKENCNALLHECIDRVDRMASSARFAEDMFNLWFLDRVRIDIFDFPSPVAVDQTCFYLSFEGNS